MVGFDIRGKWICLFHSSQTSFISFYSLQSDFISIPYSCVWFVPLVTPQSGEFNQLNSRRQYTYQRFSTSSPINRCSLISTPYLIKHVPLSSISQQLHRLKPTLDKTPLWRTITTQLLSVGIRELTNRVTLQLYNVVATCSWTRYWATVHNSYVRRPLGLGH